MITFNSYSLENSYLLINQINKSDAPAREINYESLSFQDGFTVVSGYWRSRTIVIRGTLDAISTNHMGALLDELKKNLSGINKNLDVDNGAVARRYKATLTRFEAPEDHYNITHLPYTAEFICQPFGYGTVVDEITSEDNFELSYTDLYPFSGSYKPQPHITLSFDSATDATGVTITNHTTGDTIEIETDISSDDVIVINTEACKVTKNGQQIDFYGPIPSFIPGDNSVTFDIAATAAQYDLSITYTPRYL
jgi:phage-related protein